MFEISFDKIAGTLSMYSNTICNDFAPAQRFVVVPNTRSPVPLRNQKSHNRNDKITRADQLFSYIWGTLSHTVYDCADTCQGLQDLKPPAVQAL